MTDTRVLAVANQKGGVAKTTTVASLGAAMVEKGRRVLLVDLDPQGCLTFSLGQDPDKLPVSVHEVLLGEVEPNAVLVTTMEGMTLLPANIDLAGAEAMLLMRAGREYALKRALAKFSDRFDVVIIDCPPSLGVLTLNGLTAADKAIVPLQCEMLAHRGVGQFRGRSPMSSRSPIRICGCWVHCRRCTTLEPPTPVTCCSMSPTATTYRCWLRPSPVLCASLRPAPRARR